MSLGSKIKIIFTAVMLMSMLSSSLAYAERFSQAATQSAAESKAEEIAANLKAKSSFDFAKQTQGYVALMELANNQDEAVENFLKDYIPCQDEICNRGTQKCIKASSTSNANSGGSTYGGTQSNSQTTATKCRCVDINEKPENYNQWYFFDYHLGIIGKAEYKEAPEGCDGTIRQSIVSNAMGVAHYTVKRTCWNNSSDGSRYCMYFHGDEASIQYANESNKATYGCEVFPVKLYNYRKCFFCPLVGVIYDGSAKITDIAFSKLAAAFATLLAIGFAIWVALQVLTQVSSLTKQDAPKFLAGLIKQSYKVLIAFLLLQYSQQVFTYAVRPVLETGLIFGKNMLTTTQIFDGIGYENGKYVRQAKAVTGGQHYKLDTYDELEAYVVAIQQQIAFMQSVGTSLVCTGSNLMMFKEGISAFGDGFQMLIQGATIAIFGFLLSLAFVFYLIDAIVQFGVVGGLLPFMIASWPFKATAKFTGTGVQMLMNSAFLFLFVGLVISANVMLIDKALSQTQDEKVSQQAFLCEDSKYAQSHQEACDKIKDSNNKGFLYEIALTLNSKNSAKLKELTDISTMGFLILLFCCIFGFKFTGQAIPLSNKFASGAISKPIAPGIATMGASFAKSAALKATEPTREAIGNHAERFAKNIAGAPFRGVGALWRTIRGKNKKPGSGGGANPQAVRGLTNPAANGGSSGGAAAGGSSAAVLNEGAGKTNKAVLNEGAAAAANPAANAQATGGTANPQAAARLNEGSAPIEAEVEGENPQNDTAATDDNAEYPQEAENNGTAGGAKAPERAERPQEPGQRGGKGKGGFGAAALRRGRQESLFVCQQCGAEYDTWQKQCGSCGGENTITKDVTHG